jgi:3-hydroxyisobutyrate dehydrogenase-like beta-hydroxyacid dehydrogenase
VGLIGLGNMGTAFGERLLEGGYELVVSNRTPGKSESLEARGARLAGTPEELAAQVDVVLTSLADDEAFEAVATRVVDAARPGTVLVDASTVSAASSARVAAHAEARSVRYLRAPVSGNPSVVRAGNLSFVVSGERETLDEVEPLLLAIGPTIHHVGDAGGVSRSALLEVMGNSAVGAPFVKYKTDALLRDDYSATFTTSLMEKDIDLALDAADELGVELPLAAEMKAQLHAAIDAGYADDDFIALFQHLRRRIGLSTGVGTADGATRQLEQEVVP